jgi:malate/lactate dehydrogenase
MPAVLGRGGVMMTVDVPLNDEEKEGMKRSVECITKCVEDVENRWKSKTSA